MTSPAFLITAILTAFFHSAVAADEIAIGSEAQLAAVKQHAPLMRRTTESQQPAASPASADAGSPATALSTAAGSPATVVATQQQTDSVIGNTVDGITEVLPGNANAAQSTAVHMPEGQVCAMTTNKEGVDVDGTNYCPLLVAQDKRCDGRDANREIRQGAQNPLGVVATLEECTALAARAGNVTLFAYGTKDGVNKDICEREDTFSAAGATTGAGYSGAVWVRTEEEIENLDKCIGENCCTPGLYEAGEWNLYKLRTVRAGTSLQQAQAIKVGA